MASLKSVGIGLLALVALGICGCTTLNPLEVKSFIDPGELGRYRQESLLLPILDYVDPKIEEPKTEFVNAVEPTQEDLTNSTGDYRISKNDLLSIEISELQGPGTQTTKTTRVTESGNISLPYLSSPIHAEGQTESQLEQTIVERYRSENIIQKAQVAVIVQEARGRAFSILGQVGRPGQYAIVDPDFRVLDALVLAGDTISPLLEDLYVIRHTGNPSDSTAPGTTLGSPAAPGSRPSSGPDDLAPHTSTGRALGSFALGRTGPRAIQLDLVDPGDVAPAGAATTTSSDLVSGAQDTATPTTGPTSKAAFDGFHELVAPTDVKIIHIPLARLKNGDLQYNIVIKPRDQIIVQPLPTGVYYVGAHVLSPGAYTLTGQRITIKQAIIGAHMLDQLAIPARTDIIRRLGDNKEVFVRVDLDKIFAGRQPDIYIKPNDQIMVGTNMVAPFLSAIRGAFRITYGFGFLYDRNFSVTNSNGVAQ